VDGIILAGGRSSRLSGQDKGLLDLAGWPLVKWVATRVAPQVHHLAISANRNHDHYATVGYRVVADELSGQPGPLAGILSAARHLGGPWLLAVPCDTPFLPNDLASRLLRAAMDIHLAAVHAAASDQAHYAVLLLHRDVLPDMADYLAQGGRQLRAWLARHGARGVPFENAADAFFNINTPEDLRRAQQLALDQPHPNQPGASPRPNAQC
jgi:molybdopterin-guanine dinucleotide biosynthesis protein A